MRQDVLTNDAKRTRVYAVCDAWTWEGKARGEMCETSVSPPPIRQPHLDNSLALPSILKKRTQSTFDIFVDGANSRRLARQVRVRPREAQRYACGRDAVTIHNSLRGFTPRLDNSRERTCNWPVFSYTVSESGCSATDDGETARGGPGRAAAATGATPREDTRRTQDSTAVRRMMPPRPPIHARPELAPACARTAAGWWGAMREASVCIIFVQRSCSVLFRLSGSLGQQLRRRSGGG